jgi:ribonuclease HI
MIFIYTDAAVRGNPSDLGAYAFFVVKGNGLEECIKKSGSCIPGKITNNYAEYFGIIEALKYAKAEGLDDILVRSDSNLAIQQINGNFKVKNAALIGMHEQVLKAAREFEKIEFEWVPRTNRWLTRVDEYCNRVLDGARV